MVKRIFEHEINLFPSEIAEAFCDLDADEQAEFFSCCAMRMKQWKENYTFQLQKITDSEFLTDDARYLMRRIGEYGEK